MSVLGVPWELALVAWVVGACFVVLFFYGASCIEEDAERDDWPCEDRPLAEVIPLSSYRGRGFDLCEPPEFLNGVEKGWTA